MLSCWHADMLKGEQWPTTAVRSPLENSSLSPLPSEFRRCKELCWNGSLPSKRQQRYPTAGWLPHSAIANVAHNFEEICRKPTPLSFAIPNCWNRQRESPWKGNSLEAKSPSTCFSSRAMCSEIGADSRSTRLRRDSNYSTCRCTCSHSALRSLNWLSELHG